MVLDHGNIVEYSTPKELLNDKGSVFYGIVWGIMNADKQK